MFLELQGIRKSFGSGDSYVEVLEGIDLSVEKGEFCVLLGPSGSGKSTLLNIIGGIDEADAGEICVAGDSMSKMKEKMLLPSWLPKGICRYWRMKRKRTRTISSLSSMMKKKPDLSAIHAGCAICTARFSVSLFPLFFVCAAHCLSLSVCI